MSVNDHDYDRLRRALTLARKGRFAVEPNPPVGCVLEKDGAVVGEGFHVAYGGPHAEVVALAEAGEAARGATAYVSLEPCSRAGKTGACTEALLRAGVVRVVYAAADPNMDADDLEGLRQAGVRVEGPVLPEEGAGLLARFLRARETGRPWTILKWAMTLDGRIAPGAGRGAKLSGPEARRYVHDLRAHCDAVAVGVDTVLADDPRLTCRLEEGPPHGRPQPLRVVFDSTLRTPPAARLFEDTADAPLLLFSAQSDASRRRALEAQGAEVEVVPFAQGGLDLAAALDRLHARGIRRLLVEGGARIHGSVLRARLADQVSAIVTLHVLGAADAPAAVAGTGFSEVEAAARLREAVWRPLGEDVLVQGYVEAASRPGA